MERFEAISRKVILGDRITEADALYLFHDFHDLIALGQLAEQKNKTINQDVVFYNINRHINPTNICALNCKFCAYSRKIGEPGAYAYSIETMVEKAGEAVRQGATEVHMVGGLHPRWGFDHYLNMIKSVKEAFPALHIKAFTAVELDWLARKSRQKVDQVLEKLCAVGLGSLPGGGAEIFHPEIRDSICDTKVSADQWLGTHRTAHGMGMYSNATMLYGHIEKYTHRVDHMARLRTLQDETQGFNAFIPLAFQPFQNEMGITRYTLGVDDLKTLAIARIFLDNFKHIKAYWVMLGQDIAQIALNFGANDLDGTVIEEKISRMAGGRSGMALSRSLIKNLIERADRIPAERDTLYHPLENLTVRTLSRSPRKDSDKVEENLLESLKTTLGNEPSDKGLSRELSSQLKSFVDIGSANTFAQLARLRTQTFFPELSVTRSRTLHLSWGSPGKVKISVHGSVEAKAMVDLPLSAAAIKDWLQSPTVDEPESQQGNPAPDSFTELFLDISLLTEPVPNLSEPQSTKEKPWTAPILDLLNILAQLDILTSKLHPVSLHIRGLKALWHLCRGQEGALMDGLGAFQRQGVTSIQSSPLESEMDLTSREITTLHRAACQSGLWSGGKLEIVGPALQTTAMAGDHRPLWDSFLKRAETLGSLVPGIYGLLQVRVEAAPTSFVTPLDYLKAIAIARIALPANIQIVAPFLSLPTLGLAKGEGSQSYQHPAEKLAPLVAYYGAQSLGSLDVMQTSPRAILDLVEGSGILAKGLGEPVPPSRLPLLPKDFGYHGERQELFG